MTNPRIAAWICFVCLTALLFSGCATEPADAQPAAAPNPVIETIAPAGNAAAASTPQAPDEAPADLAAEALPEGPDHLAALDDPRGAEGALLTPDQLADSANTFAHSTGLQGLTASQPELREGSPDFLARTIVFVNSVGEQVGMVIAISETRQIHIWVNENGKAICQYTDQPQALEGAACDEAIAQYWGATQEAQQEQAAIVEAEQSQSWTVLTQEDIAERLANPDTRTEIREQAKYVLGADELDDEEFAEQLGGHMVEITANVGGSIRTNAAVIDDNTNADEVVSAVTAAREQGLKILGNVNLYVTHNPDNIMRIWMTGKPNSKDHGEVLTSSYRGKETFMSFISYDSSTGVVTFQDLSKENYTALGMGTIEQRNKGIVSKTGPQWQYAYSIDNQGLGRVDVVSPLQRLAHFTPNQQRQLTPYTLEAIEAGDAESWLIEKRLKVAIAELDSITAQQSIRDAAIYNEQGASYIKYMYLLNNPWKVSANAILAFV